MDLKTREWECPACVVHHHRDENDTGVRLLSHWAASVALQKKIQASACEAPTSREQVGVVHRSQAEEAAIFKYAEESAR